ncbi:MAG TPA: DNA replication and repair protein RecF [Chitinophagaceae bacterium]|nr:DNA replication and repair protein RecF [Chitinophagaceae bacterium]
MLRLQHISLVQFKNYSNRSFDFKERIIGICGKNGVGKTNLLDAIHYLCFTKSYFTRLDGTNVQHGNTGFRIEAAVSLNDNPDSYREEKAVCILRETGRKEFWVNDGIYEKFSQHIGRYPCVVIAPDDAELITGESKERRKFLDALLCQLDSEYMQLLIAYKKILEQRNSLLKAFAETGNKDFSLLDVLDEQLIKPGNYVFNKRKEFLFSFLPLVKHLYNDISQPPADAKALADKEDVNLFYESELLLASFEELLKLNRSKDCLALRTTSGIHRDDLEILLGEQDFKSIASQGQRKSLLFALKLAEMEVLKKEKGFAPLLLLDDVFEKLDEDRIGNLLNKVCVENDGQVFITDTNEERLRSHLSKLGVAFEMIRL